MKSRVRTLVAAAVVTLTGSLTAAPPTHVAADTWTACATSPSVKVVKAGDGRIYARGKQTCYAGTAPRAWTFVYTYNPRTKQYDYRGMKATTKVAKYAGATMVAQAAGYFGACPRGHYALAGVYGGYRYGGTNRPVNGTWVKSREYSDWIRC